MARFVVGDDRSQSTLFPERLDEYLGEDNPVRAIDVFVDELDLAKLGFGGVEPEATGRPAYHPATLLKIYVYGYLNRVQSSRSLERECQRNIELVWLTGRLMPDFKTIADFRKDNGEATRRVCREFVMLCRRLELFSEASVAIDGSKFKAVNTRDRNFTQAKMERRLVQIDESIARYLAQLDSADRQGDSVPEAKITRLNEKIVALRQEMQRLNQLNSQMMESEDKQISLTDPDARSMATSGRGSGMVGYNVQSAVDTRHHLIVAHEVTNVGSDRDLCLPETKSDNTDDEVRRGSAEQRAVQAAGSADGPANPCPETGAFGTRCNSRCRPQRSAANGPRRRQPYDQGTPCGSSRSVFPHTRSAKVTAGPLGDLGYPSPLDAS